MIFPASQAQLDRPCPWAVRSAALSPSGHLVACCGIEAADNEVLDFGDAQTHSATWLAQQASQDLLVNAISTAGPYRLLQLARALDRQGAVKTRERYASMCEACEDLVRQPDALAVLRKHRVLVEREIAAKAAPS